MDRSSHGENPKSKPYLRLLPKPKAKLGGRIADDMAPGKYLAGCEGAWLDPTGKGQGHKAVLQFRILDGKYDGVAVRQWIDNAIDEGGFVSPHGKYARHCWIALGRELREDDPVEEPGQFFSGKRFIVSIGYRKTEFANGRGRGRWSNDLALIRKGDDDYLRVHEIVERYGL